jgi:hypothetical protein
VHHPDEGRDRPLSCNWRLDDPDRRASFGLAKGDDLAEEAILAMAMQTFWSSPAAWISYSRRRQWWSGGAARSWWGPEFTYTTVVRAVDRCAELGLLEHDRKPPGNRGWQSRFRAGPELVAAMSATPPGLRYEPRELILLRGEHDEPLEYRRTRVIEAMRDRLDTINGELMAARVDMDRDTPCLNRWGDWIQLTHKHAVHRAARPMHRVFNRDFRHGGRFYGPWWQSLPGPVRRYLVIDGEPTGELDFGQTHPRMLAAAAGLDIGRDAYEIEGWDRPLVKIGLNIAINAPTHRSAIRAIAKEIGGKGAFAEAESLVEAIKGRHPKLAPRLHSGAGLQLQRQDADISEAIVSRMLSRGVVTLGIHDSFIVPRKHLDLLEAEMHAVWAESVGTKAIINSTN